MTARVIGRIDWGLQRDKDGHRDYTVDFLVKADDYDDGPFTAMLAEDLPIPGSFWQYGNDTDPAAWCSPEMSVEPVYAREKGYFWIVKNKFSTRPLRRCQDNSVDNPLFEPYRIGGSFATYSEEAFYDRLGRPIMSSSFEMYEGSDIEFDAGRPTVSIGFNSADMPVPVFANIMHMVNDSYLWGLPARTIKLSGVRWQRLLYGTCSFYYSVDYEFEIKYDTWDRFIPDMGTRRVKDIADKDDPTKFIKYQDRNHEYAKCFLNGSGMVATTIGEVKQWKIEKYQQGNLLLLGIPSDLTTAA